MVDGPISGGGGGGGEGVEGLNRDFRPYRKS